MPIINGVFYGPDPVRLRRRTPKYPNEARNFARFNEIMSEYFTEPYPARAAVQVSALPKGGVVEAEAVMFRPSE